MTSVIPVTPADTVPVPAQRTRLAKTILRRPAGAVAVAWILLITLGAVLADFIAPYGPEEQDLSASYSLPSADHLLGADQLGRDILSRILFGGQVSLLAVLVAVVVFVVVGVSIGLFAGYRGGLTDRLVMRGSEIFMAIPLVVTLLVVLAIFSRNETAAMVTFGLLASAGLVRVVRASTMAVRSDDYVQAAIIAGLTAPQIVVRHILPRVAGPVLIQTSLLAGAALLVEGGLNYLGLGVQPPTPSWGGLVADASAAIFRQPWMLIPGGGIITLTALAFGVIGDVARDATADRSSMAPRSWREMKSRIFRSNEAEDRGHRSEHGTLLTLRSMEVTAKDVSLVGKIDLSVDGGEIVGIVGESGCGKTMLVSALMRLLPPGVEMSASKFIVNGEDLLQLSERDMATRRGSSIGFIPQEPVAGLDPAFTVGSQLRELVRHHQKGTRTSIESRVRELLQLVQLPDPDRVLNLKPHELSGGMAQRVAIARSLIGNPRLLIADEPTTALDVTVQAGILNLLRSLRDKVGLSVLLVTHDWGVVADLCDRAVVLYAGEIVEEGDIRTLMNSPRHPYTRALLDANPSHAAFREPLRSIPGSVPPPGSRGTGCRFANRCPRRQDDCLSGVIELGPSSADHEYRCLHPEPSSILEGGSHNVIAR